MLGQEPAAARGSRNDHACSDLELRLSCPFRDLEQDRQDSGSTTFAASTWGTPECPCLALPSQVRFPARLCQSHFACHVVLRPDDGRLLTTAARARAAAHAARTLWQTHGAERTHARFADRRAARVRASAPAPNRSADFSCRQIAALFCKMSETRRTRHDVHRRNSREMSQHTGAVAGHSRRSVLAVSSMETPPP